MAHQSAVSTQHSDLITSVRFSHHHRLATSSLDHTIRVTSYNRSTSAYDTEPYEWKAHDSPVLDLSWAEPEFGVILASGAVDGSIKIWSFESVKSQTSTSSTSTMNSGASTMRTQQQNGTTTIKKWNQKAILTDARGTIRSIEFSPAQFGLKLASISSDSHLRVWECLDPIQLNDWSIINDIDLNVLPNTPSNSQSTNSNLTTASINVPGTSTGEFTASTSASSLTTGFDASTSPNKSVSSSANNLSSTVATSSSMAGSSASGSSFEGRKNLGTIETDGAWSLSWCKEAWWGERLAVSSGHSGIIRLFHLPSHQPWSNFLNLLPPRSSSSSSSSSTPSPTCSLSWAPASGRSFQLLASGSKNGKTRIWKIYPSSLRSDDDHKSISLVGGGGEGEWKGELDAELDESKGTQGGRSTSANGNNGSIANVKVTWNLTGTVLSTAGDDAKVRLWKSTYTGQWRTIAVLSTQDVGDDDDEMRE